MHCGGLGALRLLDGVRLGSMGRRRTGKIEQPIFRCVLWVGTLVVVRIAVPEQSKPGWQLVCWFVKTSKSSWRPVGASRTRCVYMNQVILPMPLRVMAARCPQRPGLRVIMGTNMLRPPTKFRHPDAQSQASIPDSSSRETW